MIKGSRRALKAWGSGLVTPDVFDPGTDPVGDYAAIVVLARGGHLQDLIDSGLIGPQSRVFAPSVHDDGPEPLLMGYEGSLSDPGGEVQVGSSFFLQTQDYGTSEYLSLIGATLVRVVDDQDLATFLEDADRARDTGDFQEFLTHHLVRLCDAPALGAPTGDDGPGLRVWVDEQGAISTSPSGLRLGELGDTLPQLEKEWQSINDRSDGDSCSVCLGAVVDETTRSQQVARRPWLARYHAALSGLQHLRGRDIGLDGEVRVSGFGGRLDPALADVADPADERTDAAPVLMWVGNDVYLHDGASDRSFRLDRDTGVLAERLLVHGSVDSAAATGHREALTKVSSYFGRSGVSLCE